MSRLKHSSTGYIRSMQMSAIQVFIFVEGKSDNYFYSKVAESVYSPIGVSYRICQIQQVLADSGGKEALISWFKILKRRSILVNNFKGKVTRSIFFLDKDVDDFLKSKYKSDHIVYTKYYDIENHIFREGNSCDAIAATSFVDRQSALTIIGNYENWRQTIAEYWKDWVKICLFAKKHNVQGKFNYGVRSPINSPLHEPVNSIMYDQHLTELEIKSGLSSTSFKRAFKQISIIVDILYAKDEYDHVFKGKWYAPIIIEQIKTKTGIPLQNFHGLQEKLPGYVVLTLDFNQPWAEHFKEPLKRLLSLS